MCPRGTSPRGGRPRRGLTGGSVACLLAVLAVTVVVGPGEAREISLAQWRFGPIRYLITGAEDKGFKRLTTDEQRREFIVGFWKRRDPTPETPGNELRDAFFRRVEEANRLFVGTTKIGWKTDRGRLYILLGPPDEQEIDPMRKERRGEIRWIYRAAPSENSGPNRVIAFQEDPSGEYRLSANPRDYDLVFSFLTRSSLVLPPNAADSMPPPPGPTDGEIRLDIGRMIVPPGERELIREIVTVEEYPGVLPFVPRFDFYRSPDGLTFVAINVGIEPWILPPETDTASLLPIARLENIDEAHRVYDFVYSNPFVPAPDNGDDGYLIFQAGQGMVPGRYRAYIGIFDRDHGSVLSRHDELTVPEFPVDGLTLSSLTLARHAELASGDESAGPYKRPFVLAGRRVVPRLAPTYHNGETFSLYFQVYGAAETTDGRSRLGVEYRFFVLDRGGFQPLGEPITSGPLTEQVVGWQFPLVGWPTAAFRLQVTVVDQLSSEETSGTVDFHVDD